mgnify:CR=1 FL=1
MAKAQTLSASCLPEVGSEARVLILGDAPPAALENWPDAETQSPDQHLSQRFDLALLIHPADVKQQGAFTQQLAAARDQWAKQVLTLVPLAHHNQTLEQEYFALGFSHRALHEPLSQQFCAYGFSIRHYKTTPDWLNSKFWANPERWKKN